MNKIILSLFLALSLASCDEQSNKTAEITTKPVIKIGASFPLTDNMASIGNAAHKALTAAVNDANQNPDNKYYYDLMVENDQMNPQLVNTIAHKFIFSDKVNVIFSYFSVAGRIVAPLAAQNKIINFNTGFGNDVLQSRYNFQNFLAVEDENLAIVDFLKAKQVKTVDLIYQNIGAADEFLTPLLPLLDKENISYNIHRFNKEERDFSILIAKIKRSPSEAVFIYAFEPEADILTKEIRQQEIDKIIAYNDGLPMTNNYALYEGYYNIGSVLTPKEYQTSWGLTGQNAAYAAYLYDSGKIVVEAYENAPTTNKIPTSDEIAEYLLQKTDYTGTVGTYQIDSKGQFHSKGQTSIVKDGQMQVYGEE